MMWYRQKVRHKTLTLICAGSIPATTVIFRKGEMPFVLLLNEGSFFKLPGRGRMYILSKDKKILINFDNFEELHIWDEVIFARNGDRSILLGEFETPEKAKKAFDSMMKEMLNESSEIVHGIIEIE